jgi:hypothetical protein
MKVFVALATLAVMATAIQAGTIDPALKMKLQRGKSMDIDIVLESIADVFSSQSIVSIENREARIAAMISTLQARTSASQQPFVDILTRLGKMADTQTFWVTNEMFVNNADLSVVEAIASVPGDFLIREPIQVSLIEPVESRNATDAELKQTVQWGVQKIGSVTAWSKTR